MTFSLGKFEQITRYYISVFCDKVFLGAYLAHLYFCSILNYSCFYVKSPNDDLFNNVILPLLDLPINN